VTALGSYGVVVAAGVAAVLQAVFMGVMTQRLGALQSMWVTYGLGGLLVTIGAVGARATSFTGWRDLPPYVFLAGVMGLVIVGGIGLGIPRIGAVATLSVLMTTQFVVGALIDHFGWLGVESRPMDGARLVGLVVLALGAYLTLR
jgi:transporter family-2 protein